MVAGLLFLLEQSRLSEHDFGYMCKGSCSSTRRHILLQSRELDKQSPVNFLSDIIVIMLMMNIITQLIDIIISI